MEAREMEALWDRLKSWLQNQPPAVLSSLQPGATEQQILDTEALLSVQFPEDFKASYRIHNGQINLDNGLLDGRELLSLDRIQDEWTIWKDLLDGGDFEGIDSEPAAGIRDDWWNPKWIPVTYDGAGNHDCLDLDPAVGGHTGQIIDFWHDDATRLVKAPSFGAWLAAFVAGCEAGQYVYSDEYGGIVDKDNM